MKEKIKTTQAKAKELKSKVDKIINKAKKSKIKEKKLSIIRELKKEIPDMAIGKLMGAFLEKFDNKSGGYARVIKLERRKSDGAEMAIIELV